MKEYRIDLHCYLKEQFNEIYEESKSRRERKKDEILQLVTPQDRSHLYCRYSKGRENRSGLLLKWTVSVNGVSESRCKHTVNMLSGRWASISDIISDISDIRLLIN